MSVSTRTAMLVEEVVQQVDCGEYADAWATYREFRESLNEEEYDARTLQVLDEAERAAETSFRTGAVGFESEMHTLQFVVRRMVRDSEMESY